MRDSLERRCGDPHAGRADRNRAGACLPGLADLALLPASCSARSLTVSRKAKKSGPGSSRRRGSPPPQATRRPVGQHPVPPPGGSMRAVTEAEASFQEDESGVPPASLAPRNGGSRRVFRTQPSARGAAREGGGRKGPYGPEEGSVAGGLWTRDRRWGQQVTMAQAGPGGHGR